VDLVTTEPLHNTNNAWQQWFSALLTVAMQYTDQAKLKTATVVSDLPNTSSLVAYHTDQLLEKLGFGLGLNSMQGQETKHVKLAKYVVNTCNVKKA